jgi:hypothetical protein
MSESAASQRNPETLSKTTKRIRRVPTFSSYLLVPGGLALSFPTKQRPCLDVRFQSLRIPPSPALMRLLASLGAHTSMLLQPTKNIIHDSRYPSLDLNPRPPEYEEGFFK